MSEYNIQMNKYNALNAEYDQLYPVTKIEDVNGLGTALQNKADTSSVYSKEESISASTRTALSLPETATPDAAFAKIAQQLSEGVGDIESTEYPGCYYRMVDDVVEWVNPPMTVGIEYRTTERYMGNPVYQQIITLGSLPSSGEVSVQIEGMKSLISAFGSFANNRFIPSFSIGSSSFGFDKAAAFISWDNNVGVMVNTSVANGSTAYCLIKYVKN